MATDVSETAAEGGTVVVPAFPAAEGLSLHRLTVEQYEEIARAGIIPSGAKVELLDGLLVNKMSKNPPHTAAVLILAQWLGRVVPDGWLVAQEIPLALVEQASMPEPDIAVMRGRPREYFSRRPVPEDVAILVEVADTSYRTDRFVKARLYAAAGVGEFWIADLNRRVLEVHTGPEAEGYRSVEEVKEDGEAVLRIEGREVGRLRVSEILP